MTEKWGIRGADWAAVRPMRDRDAAYGWAYSLANSRDDKRRPWRAAPTPIDIYIDRGDGAGWVLVEHVAVGTESPAATS
jgi:hypothetical protein